MEKIEQLLAGLKAINEGSVEVKTENGTIYGVDREGEEVERQAKFVCGEHADTLSDIATEILVDDNGPNTTYGCMLREQGFRVMAVEQDSFGWLIGGIVTNKGIISFG